MDTNDFYYFSDFAAQLHLQVIIKCIIVLFLWCKSWSYFQYLKKRNWLNKTHIISMIYIHVVFKFPEFPYCLVLKLLSPSMADTGQKSELELLFFDTFSHENAEVCDNLKEQWIILYSQNLQSAFRIDVLWSVCIQGIMNDSFGLRPITRLGYNGI